MAKKLSKENELISKKVTFSVDEETLKGDLLLPGVGRPCIFLCHGMEGSKDGAKWPLLAAKLAEQKLGSLRFNFRGCGDGDERSDGFFETTSLTGRIADLKAAMDAAIHWGASPQAAGVVGSSMGGMVAIAAEDRRIKVQALLATPVNLRDLEAMLPDQGDRFVMPSGQTILRAGLQDVARYDLPGLLTESEIPTLVLHGDSDNTVSIEHSLMLFNVAKEPKRMEIIPGGSHSLDGDNHLAQVTDLVVSWMLDYLG